MGNVGRRRLRSRRRSPRISPAVIGTMALVLAGLGAAGNSGGPDQAPRALVDPLLMVMESVSPEASGSFVAEVDVSRDFDRPEVKNRTADQARQRLRALREIDRKAGTRTDELKKVERRRNQWVLPVARYQLTARFGQRSGLWSSGVHSGLDFAGPSGTEIVALARGTVVSAGYAGSYGFRTVIRLVDGTEIWYAHQSRIVVTAGQKVERGDLTGYTGATGNVTGPHLHLEVRPPGSGPIDPEGALLSHGLGI